MAKVFPDIEFGITPKIDKPLLRLCLAIINMYLADNDLEGAYVDQKTGEVDIYPKDDVIAFYKRDMERYYD